MPLSAQPQQTGDPAPRADYLRSATPTNAVIYPHLIRAAVATGALATSGLGQHAILISADPSGLSGNGNSGIGDATSPNAVPVRGLCVTSDGRFVAFYSEASNLIAGSPFGQIFVRDVVTGSLTLGSTNSAGQPGALASLLPEISRRGRFLAFTSAASNLVANDTNGATQGWDVFVKDFQTGVTERVSVSSSGSEAHGNSGWKSGTLSAYVRPAGLAMSADGRFVAFSSDAADLVPNDTNLRTDVFLHDRRTGTTTLVSVQDPLVPATSGSLTGAQSPRVSNDGRFVGFSSNSRDLVPNDANFTWDAFVRDCTSGTTLRVSVDSQGVEADDWSQLDAISADGRFALFTSAATNLVAGQLPGMHVFLHDLVTGQTTLECVDSLGQPTPGGCGGADLSPDGRFVLFVSSASTLVPGDTNGVSDLFVRDRLLGTIRRANVAAGGVQSDAGCGLARLARGGRAAVFATSATTLSPLDVNNLVDVYLGY